MKTQLENIYTSAKADIDKSQSIADIDEIRLKYLSRKGEFNSIKKGLKDLHPCRDILKRYKKLGGEIITIGSDAHDPFYLGYEFDKASELLKECGFSSYYIFHKRHPEELPL